MARKRKTPDSAEMTAQTRKSTRKTRQTTADPDIVAANVPEQQEFKVTSETKIDGRKTSEAAFWLMKAEPESRIERGRDVKFSIDDLAAATEPEPWDGVRNVVAQKNLRSMAQGDLAFFYHSNCKAPGIVGVMEIVREHSVDESSFDPTHPYFDPKATRDRPRWSVVHVEFRSKLARFVSLKELQQYANGPLADMQLLRQSRLSVSKVSRAEWDFVHSLV